MGKGDKKSKRGKITMGTFGNSRKHRPAKARTANQATLAPKGSTTAKPTAPATTG